MMRDDKIALMDKRHKKDRHKPFKQLRLPPALYERLVQLAETNKRPVSWEGRIAIEKHVEAEERRIRDAGPDT